MFGQNCIMIEEIIDLLGARSASRSCLSEGRAAGCRVPHAWFSGGAVAKIMASKIETLRRRGHILPTEAVRVASDIEVISLAGLIGEAILGTSGEESVSSLFEYGKRRPSGGSLSTSPPPPARRLTGLSPICCGIRHCAEPFDRRIALAQMA